MNVLNDIFKQREDFIIIGLTGRTGSGCTTVAKILSSSDLRLKRPDRKCDNNEERKYKIIYKYLYNRWNPFTNISVSDIIISFLFEDQYHKRYIDKITSKLEITNGERKKENDSLINEYNILREEFNSENIIPFNKIDSKERIDGYDQTIQKNTRIFYMEKIPKFKNQLREVLGKNCINVLQDLGDDIRTNDILCLPRRINYLIQLLRKHNKENNKKEYFVIDAFRNPYEALFFKERYSAFYFFSVNTSEEYRVKRLLNADYTMSDIKDLDEKEYPHKEKNYCLLNIQKCIEYADIHINNPDYEIADDYHFLKKQIARYVSLILHPGLVTPTKTERCMQIAYTAKINSGCISRQVGAVITDNDYSVKAIGWNDVPYGQIPCLLRSVKDLLFNEDTDEYSEYELNEKEYKDFFNNKYNSLMKNDLGRNFSFCFKDAINEYQNYKKIRKFKEDSEKNLHDIISEYVEDDNKQGELTRKIEKVIDGIELNNNQVYTRSLHAEENAFLQLAKYGGMGISGGILFTTASPCELCSKKAYQLGIKKIIYIDPYPGIAIQHILKCGSNMPELELFSGAIGGSYHKLYEPIIPFKDELKLIEESQSS